MAKSPKATRVLPNQDHLTSNAFVTLEAAPAASRISLRASPRGAAAFAKNIGFDLPAKPSTSKSKSGVVALWLGPDEWMVFSESEPEKSLQPRRDHREYSATDISHRNTAYIVSGSGAQATLNSSCPRDLSQATFPVGACSRTILGKAEVILYRTGKEKFRVECWRSFAPYVWGLLVSGAQDANL